MFVESDWISWNKTKEFDLELQFDLFDFNACYGGIASNLQC